MLKMIIKTPVTPSSLFVKGISAKVDYDYVGRGGFGFVFKGDLGGAAVALKLLYKTRHNDANRFAYLKSIPIADCCFDRISVEKRCCGDL